MKFSVVMPVYNRERCVLQSIESVIDQEFADWELIIIDDGSEDNTLKLCNSIAQNDSRVKVYSQLNKGVSAARNSGLKVAVGEYVLFLDSDDFLEMNALKDMETLIKQNAYPDILG